MNIHLITDHINKYNFTIEQFGRLCKTNIFTIKAILNNNNNFPLQVFINISKEIGCSLIDLFSDELSKN